VSKLQPRREPSIPTLQHATTAEYTAFVQAYTDQAEHGARLLRFHKQFVQRYPDLRDWFAAPLRERIGRIAGETWDHPSHPISLHARLYLMFLALHGYAPLDWEWLIAAHELCLARILRLPDFTSDFSALVEEAVTLGYEQESARLTLQWAVHRIFLHIATTRVEDIRAHHLVECAEALERFGHRPDVALFFGSNEHYQRIMKRNPMESLHLLQTVLYHRGQVQTAPKVMLSVPSRPVVKPQMETVMARYLTTRGLTGQPGTIKHTKKALLKFIDWLAQTHPVIETWTQVTRDHVMEYAEALNTMISTRQRPFAAGTKYGLLSCLSVFFQDTIAWGWDDVPNRPPLQHGDLPKLPKSIPRYIPPDELDRLMPAIRSLACPYQRAALLIARWSGARREEIQRLSVDCLDSYPDGTPRLRVPAGKTKRERLVPLNQEAADAIRLLQSQRKRERGLYDRHTGVETRYLFVHHGKQFSLRYLFENPLRKICAIVGLTTSDNKATVTAHRFRHTVGTQLAQRGARLRTIQKILGHESIGMSMVYIGLTDEDVRQDYQAILGPGATIAGPGAQLVRSGELAESEIRWIQENFFKTELELGRCLRLPQEGPCECDLYLTCAKFVTAPEYAPRLRRRRRIEQELVEDAHTHGWPREVERHQCTIRRIEQLLMDLGEPLDGPEASG
jgi:integrase